MSHSLLLTLSKKESPHIPVWYMRQAGRYLPEYLKLREQEADFIRFCLTPSFCIEAVHQPLRRFDLDGAILFADILLIPYALGQKVHFEKGFGPRLESLSFPKFLETAKSSDISKLSPVYETIKGLKQSLPQDKALIGFSGGVWTLACYMLAGKSEPNQETTKHFMFSQKEHFDELIAILIEAVSDYLIKQIEAGADVIQIFDSWSGVLPWRQFEEYVIAPTAQIIKKIRLVYPDTPIIGFPRGSGQLCLPYAQETGISAISIDSNFSFSWIRDNLQKIMPVQGNLDPQLLVAGGPAMLAAAEEILTELGEGGLIFGLSHGIVPQTPPENVLALTQFVRSYKKK